MSPAMEARGRTANKSEAVFFLKRSVDHNTSLDTGEQRERSRENKGLSYPLGSCCLVGKRGLIHMEKFLKGLKKHVTEETSQAG